MEAGTSAVELLGGAVTDIFAVEPDSTAAMVFVVPPLAVSVCYCCTFTGLYCQLLCGSQKPSLALDDFRLVAETLNNGIRLALTPI